MKQPPNNKPPGLQALEALGANVTASVVAAILTAVAGSVVFVAAAFGVYAFAKTWVSLAAASALTALAFALIMATLAGLAPRMIKARSNAIKAQAVAAPVVEAGTIRIAADIALAVIGAVAEARLRRGDHRSSHKRKPRS